MDLYLEASTPELADRAAELAERLALPLAPAGQAAAALRLTPDRLELRWGGGLRLHVEFRPPRRNPLLLRATLAGREPRPDVVDATAGLGQDAFELAWAGCQVTMLERSSVVAALLEDGLARAARDPELAPAVGRLRLAVGDAADQLPLLPRPDVVYLDPMYPLSGREGAKNKGMQALRLLLGGDDDAWALLEPARRSATRRVAVKRPLRAPPLAGVPPSGVLRGTTVRYDLYAPLA